MHPSAQTAQPSLANPLSSVALLLAPPPSAPAAPDLPLPRDQAPSSYLHQPGLIELDRDPITGAEISDPWNRPRLLEGNLLLHFESDETLDEYLAIPIDHPFRLQDNPDGEGYDEG